MATPVNDRDVLLQSATRDLDPRASKYLNLSVTTPIFHVATNGVPTPASIDFLANPINIGGGTVVWSISAGTLTGTGNTRTLTFGNMPVDSVTVTATITDLGQTYTATQVISKVADGATGAAGTGSSPPMYANAILYKWSTVNPGLPTGTSTLSWSVGANTSYVGTDSWFTTIPANPGTPGILLWTAQKPVSAAAGTATTDITYSAGATLAALSANGASGGAGPQGIQGVPGIKSAIARAYKWALGAAPTATGSATYTWATATYNNVPTVGWSATKSDAPALGYTLYEASVGLVDATGVTTSSIDWTTATIVGIGYMATNGTQGTTGDSTVIGYSLVDGFSLNSTPATTVTTGKAYPSTGVWGETRAWAATPSNPAAGQSVFQINGIYNATSNQTTWAVPYLSALRVGSLSALTVNTGSLNISGTISSANGNFSVDSSGNASAKSITIRDASNNIILSSGTALNPAYAAAGTLNSQQQWSDVSGTGRPADNATVGASFGVNIGGQITAGNVGTYVATNAISSTYISDLVASKITAGTLAAGVVYAGTINANQINAGTLNAFTITTATSGARIALNESSNNRLKMYADVGSGVEAVMDAGYQGAGVPLVSVGTYTASNSIPGIRAYSGSGIGLQARSTSGFGINAESSSNYAIYGTSSTGIVVFLQGGTRECIQASTTGTSANSCIAATSTNGIGVYGNGGTYDFYAGGPGMNYGPFTGGHDGLVKLDTLEFTQGDILVDVAIVNHSNISNTIAENALSSKPMQKNVVGVYVAKRELVESFPPAGLKGVDNFDEIANTYKLVMFNALGEGQINVCGENGDIEAGDYITTSSIPGKGMRQADDILHNYTVAKARESVTFSSSDEVKMIACTYHCG